MKEIDQNISLCNHKTFNYIVLYKETSYLYFFLYKRTVLQGSPYMILYHNI